MLWYSITAYVSGEKTGLILENSYSMGETLNGVSGLDINFEKGIIEQKLNELRLQGASDKDITQAMKDLGIQRLVIFFSGLNQFQIRSLDNIYIDMNLNLREYIC